MLPNNKYYTMQFQKGHTKTGGRKAGTPNKATSFTRETMANLLNQYANSGMMSEDFLALDPKDRITMAERIAQYIIPKMQATALDVSTAAAQTIEERLRQLAKDND